MERVTPVVLAIGFAATIGAILFVGHELKEQMVIVAKQIDSQPYRIAEEANLPPFKTPVTRPALQELPPEVIQRITSLQK